MKLYYYLTLMRPANIMTALSDILGGVAISGFLIATDWDKTSWSSVGWLLLATIGLYAGGIVFNDIFDLKDDRVNRPERILPSGKVSVTEASVLGIVLFVIGIVSAFMVSKSSGILALIIMVLALTYDKIGKHHSFLGPLNMGLCRGGNLLLGMSIIPENIFRDGYMVIIPVLFIAAITLTGQKEVSGNNKTSILLAMLLDAVVVILFIGISQYGNLNLKIAAPFLILWYGINFLAKYKAYKNNQPDWIKKAVKTGVLSLILLNACYIAGFANWNYALPVLILLPLSVLLARKFAVT